MRTPPKEYQFPVNRKDHTQKGPYLLPIIKRFLNKKIKYIDPETQQKIEGKVKDAVIWRLILNATEGETLAIKEILNRLDGKVVQKIEIPDSPGINIFIANILQKAGVNGQAPRLDTSDTKGESELSRV
jgi:hypothetical protein